MASPPGARQGVGYGRSRPRPQGLPLVGCTQLGVLRLEAVVFDLNLGARLAHAVELFASFLDPCHSGDRLYFGTFIFYFGTEMGTLF